MCLRPYPADSVAFHENWWLWVSLWSLLALASSRMPSHITISLSTTKGYHIGADCLRISFTVFEFCQKNPSDSPLRFWDFPTWICKQWKAVSFKSKTQCVSLINSRTAFGDNGALYLFIYLLCIYLFYTNAFNSPYLYHIARHITSYEYSPSHDIPPTTWLWCPTNCHFQMSTTVHPS